MDLFYRGHDPNARITSAAQHLTAAAARFAVSMIRSISKLPHSAWTEFKRLLTVDALWSLCLVLAGWLIATVVGGLVGLAVNALLIFYGLVELWEQVKAVSKDLQQWAMTAYVAQNDADLDRASAHFAAALSTGGIVILEVVVTHRVFRAVEAPLRERFPAPEWLRQEYQKEVLRRESRRPQESQSLPQHAVKVADIIRSGSRGEGMRKVASNFPTTTVIVGSVILGVGLAATLKWAASSESRKVAA